VRKDIPMRNEKEFEADNTHVQNTLMDYRKTLKKEEH
jgi:hypothetical protein